MTGRGDGNEGGWQDNIIPGSSNMVYVETNTFSNYDTGIVCSGIESYYGSRNVLRNNTLNFCQFDQHGTADSVGARWWEIYNNNIVVPSGQQQCCGIVVRDGSGVIWGNTVTCNGCLDSLPDIELYSDNSGAWPLAWQIGAGITDYTNGYATCQPDSAGAGTGLNSSPAYVWGNTGFNGVDTNGNPSGTVYLNQDFLALFLTAF